MDLRNNFPFDGSYDTVMIRWSLGQSKVLDPRFRCPILILRMEFVQTGILGLLFNSMILSVCPDEDGKGRSLGCRRAVMSRWMYVEMITVREDDNRVLIQSIPFVNNHSNNTAYMNDFTQ